MQIDINTQKIPAIKAYRDWVEQTFGFRTGLKQSKDAVELLAAEKAEQDAQRRHRVLLAEYIFCFLCDEGIEGHTRESVFERLFLA